MKVVFEVEFLLIDFVEGIFEYLFSTNRDRMEPLSEFLLLTLYYILEDLSSQSKGDGVRHVDEDCVAYLSLDSFIREVI